MIAYVVVLVLVLVLVSALGRSDSQARTLVPLATFVSEYENGKLDILHLAESIPLLALVYRTRDSVSHCPRKRDL